MEYEWDDIDVDYPADYLARINEMERDYFDQQVSIDLSIKIKGKIRLDFFLNFLLYCRPQT